jgi:hypothetical protein
VNNAKLLMVLCVGGIAALGACASSTTHSSTTSASPSATSGTSTSGTSTSTSSGGACVELTVKNYLAWCTVGVDGKAGAAGPSQTVCVEPGEIALTATANPSFELGTDPWHDTDGDTGNGDPGTVSGTANNTTIKITAGEAAKCVWVCCEGQNGDPPCPSTDQCP